MPNICLFGYLDPWVGIGMSEVRFGKKLKGRFRVRGGSKVYMCGMFTHTVRALMWQIHGPRGIHIYDIGLRWKLMWEKQQDSRLPFGVCVFF